MNAGFANLKYLKAQLLAEALRVDTSYDAQLLAIGLGVVAQFEQFCDRKFARVEDATHIIDADRAQFLLNRFPLESVSAIAVKFTEADGWEEQTVNDYVRKIDLAAGIITLPDDAGPDYAQVRFTFTGGYWWDQTAEGNDEMPAGATGIPDDLRLAWILQCRTAWQAIDKIGQDITKTGSSSQFVTGSLGGLDLTPTVKQMLGQYQRFNLL